MEAVPLTVSITGDGLSLLAKSERLTSNHRSLLSRKSMLRLLRFLGFEGSA